LNSEILKKSSDQLVEMLTARRYAEAEIIASSLVKDYPDSGFAWKALGAALHEQGKNGLAAMQKATELSPLDPEAHNVLGSVMKHQGNVADAVSSYRRATELNPVFAAAHNNLGVALMTQGDALEALKSLRVAIELRPQYGEAHNNLGIVLAMIGRVTEAVESYQQAIQINPASASAYCNLGVSLLGLKETDAAMNCYRRALSLQPDYAEAHHNLGVAFAEIGQPDAAEQSYRRALQSQPEFPDAYNNLGTALRNLGRLDEAAACYRKALEIKPSFAEGFSNLLYLHAFTRDISPEAECLLASGWERVVLNDQERTSARECARNFQSTARQTSRFGRKVRIGVLSAEIGQHAVAEFLEPFLEQLDRDRFHITLFPTTLRQEPRVQELSILADEFKSLVGMSDQKAAELIRADGIDVLIDTTAHMIGCRLGVIAHRAAPVQCHYIGYHGSTGIGEMDWFIGDNALLPPNLDQHFRERIWRLPRLWIAYKGNTSLPETAWEPRSDGTVWLGSFNNLAKVRTESLLLWARVMNAIPHSILFLKDRNAISPGVQNRIVNALSLRGIGAERIKFAGHAPDWKSHMLMYDLVDIALDPIPLNSGTTAFDALWMGVPMASIEGTWMGGRMTSAILRALGKAEWVAQNEDDYVTIVTALANDVAGRRSLRSAQRSMMAASPLCDGVGLTRSLEDAFEGMLETHYQQSSETGIKEPIKA
jgi:protein O-GlcNAc transferase